MRKSVVPRREDIKKILLIGSGPIVIGQACEFDYSGTQACKALREEGYEVVLINSNPATIMTDPDMADATYIEPLTWQMVEKVIIAERPDALLPTLGGQTALNLAMDLAANGVLEKYGVEMIGANPAVIAKAEERDQFKQAMEKIGLETCVGETVGTLAARPRSAEVVGLPAWFAPASRWAVQRFGDRLQPRRFRCAGAKRTGPKPGPRSLDRTIDHRLERVRDGGDARHGRQRRDHLQHRKL
jgi:carbamoyl-phosphate synthase large subunit